MNGVVAKTCASVCASVVVGIALTFFHSSVFAISLPSDFVNDISSVGQSTIYYETNYKGALQVTDHPSQVMMYFDGGSYGTMFGSYDKVSEGWFYSNGDCGLSVDSGGNSEWLDQTESPISNPTSNSDCGDLIDTIDRLSWFMWVEMALDLADPNDSEDYADDIIEEWNGWGSFSCREAKIIGAIGIVGIMGGVGSACYGTAGTGCFWAVVNGSVGILILNDWMARICE